MIKLGVISDSHGATALIKRAVSALDDCAAIVFLGDGVQEAEAALAGISAEKYIVRGNCDIFSRAPDKLEMDASGIRVLILHGHIYRVKQGLTLVSFAAREAGAALVLYGHTHAQAIDNDGHAMYVNPGAIKRGYYAKVTIDGAHISPTLLRLD